MFCKIISICCFGCFACFETSAQLIHNGKCACSKKKLPKYHIKIKILLTLHSQKVNIIKHSVIFNAGVETEFKPENVAVPTPLNLLHALSEIEQQLHFCVFLTVFFFQINNGFSPIKML